MIKKEGTSMRFLTSTGLYLTFLAITLPALLTPHTAEAVPAFNEPGF